MTVKELIKELEKMDGGLEVWISTDHENACQAQPGDTKQAAARVQEGGEVQDLVVIEASGDWANLEET